jgi:ABC-2 type transport system ATP-binding protein
MSWTVRARGLAKWYGQVMALNDLSFELSAPLVGLLGQNGAGKSTLLRLMTGLLAPSQGEIRLDGGDPRRDRGLRGRLGYCPEFDRFYEDLTPVQFVEALARLHGGAAKAARRAAEESLERVGLQEHARRPIRVLSHGMRQRLKVAQALAHRPRFLLLDEPLAGLDPLGRIELTRLFREEAAAGCTVWISSHVLHELQALTDTVLLLHRGRLLAEGSVRRIRGLIDAHPHRIAVGCERARELGAILARLEHVRRIEFTGAGLVVETARPDDCYEELGRLGAEGDLGIHSLDALDDNLEAVFRYLTR